MTNNDWSEFCFIRHDVSSRRLSLVILFTDKGDDEDAVVLGHGARIYGDLVLVEED
jgi:hypothetical protein